MTARPPWRRRSDDGISHRFVFDIDDGGTARRDEVGLMLASEGDLARETQSVLFDLAHAAIIVGRPRVFTAKVRNARGAVVYQGTMTLRTRRAD